MDEQLEPSQLIYVHGAGPQEPPDRVKAELDAATLRDPSTTVLAHYSRVHWGTPPAEVDAEALITSLSDYRIPPEAAAARLGEHLGLRPTEDSEAEALDLIRDLYEAADTVAGIDAGPTELWDPLFRVIVGQFARDVAAYLFKDRATAMRAPVKPVLEGAVGRPAIVIAHSLGSILTFDLLSQLPELDVRLLLTAGSPLGIPNVQDGLRDRTGRPNPVPTNIRRWVNVYDDLDPVSWLKKQIAETFDLPNLIEDRPPVINVREKHHALVGYLELPSVREILAQE
jgi:pimeloyl-ACP methyl ester carboxylesterase